MVTTKKVTKLKTPAKATAAKAPSAKPATKPSAKLTPKVEPGAQSAPADRLATLSTELGKTLLDLTKQTPDADSAAVIAHAAQALVKGEPVDNKTLGELRDVVNTLAATLRTANKAALAKQFSHANRAVRRLERACRRAS